MIKTFKTMQVAVEMVQFAGASHKKIKNRVYELFTFEGIRTIIHRILNLL